jgi:hypothetical protein
MSSNKFIARNGLAVGTAATEVVDSSGTLLVNAPTATKLLTSRTISLTGDVAGSVSFDGSGNAAITTTIQPDSVALGTDTTGNYMLNVSAGIGVSVSHTQGEGSTATVSIGQAVGTTDNVTFNNVTVNGTLTSDDITSTNISVAGNATITGNLTVSGTTTTINSTIIAIADLNLELARNATTAAQANGAGITVTGPTTAATLTYTSADDRWNLNKNLNVTTVYGALSGNASTATALATGRTIAITGDLTYTSGSFDGTGNVTGAATLATVNSNVGTFGSSTSVPVVTVNAKGLVTAVSTATISGSLTFTGDVTGSGSTGSSTALTLATVNSNVGTFNNVTVNAKGLVTSASNVSYLTSYTETDTLATVTGRGATTSAQVTVDSVLTTNNGNGTNFRIGDDSWIGDINVANTFRVTGLQDGTKGYIVFGNSDNTALGRSGTGALTYGGNTIYHSGNIPSYLTSESDTLATVTGRGATTSSIVRINNQLRVGQNTNGTAYIDAYDGYAWFGRDSNTAGIRIDSSGNVRATAQFSTGSYARLGDGISNPAGTTFSHTIAGVGANNFRVVNFDGNGSRPSVWWTNGSRALFAIDALDAAGASIWANDGTNWQQQMAVNYGNVTINTDIRSPIFYDSNDTTYYLDPNGSSKLGGSLQMYAGSSGNSPYIYLGAETSAAAKAIFLETYYIRIQGHRNEGIRFHGVDGSGNRLEYFGMFGDNNASYGNRSYLNFYAPIMYDSNDTAYYLDPNSTTRVNNLTVVGTLTATVTTSDTLATVTGRGATTTADITIGGGGSDNGLRINHGGGSSDYGRIRFYQAGTNNQTIHVFSTAWQGGTLAGASAGAINLAGANGVTFGNWNDVAMWVSTAGDGQAKLSLRAPIFYDSDNTGFYVNPNSSSNLNTAYANFFCGNGSNGYGQYKGYDNNNHFISIRGIVGGNTTTPTITGGHQTTLVEYAEANDTSGWFFKTAQTGNYDIVSRITRSYSSFEGSARAPIFYDSNDTGYYLDPNSSTTSLYMNGGIITTAPGGTVLMRHLVSEVDAWLFMENAANWGLYWKNNPSGNHVFGGYTTIGAELVGMSAANASGNGVATTNFVGATSAIAQWMISNYTGYMWSASTIFAAGDMRAPIFYDSNDTGYYLNPNGGSNLNTVNATRFSAPNNGLISVGDDSATYTYDDGSTRSRVYVSSAYPAITINGTIAGGNANHGPTLQFTHNGYDSNRQWVIGTGGSGQQLDFGTGQPANKNPHEGIAGYSGTTCMRMTVGGNVGIGGSWGYYGTVANPSYRLHVQGTAYASSDMRAPVFYDSDNTAYYIDPSSTANASMTITGIWYFRSNRNTSSDSPPLQAFSNDGGGAIMSFHRGGYYAVNMGLDSDNVMRIGGWSAATNRWQLDMSGNETVAGSSRAPIFYDSDNTGYYLNPNGVSVLGGTNDMPLRVYKASGVNSCCTLFENSAGDNSWGIVSEFRVGSANQDSPGILFSQATNSNTWTLGFGYADTGYFRINRDHGHRNQSWGTTLMTMDRSGNVTFAGNVTANSDERIKKNIKKIENSLQLVQQLEGVTFNYVEDDREGLGFIAQQVEKVLPVLVSETPSSNGETYKNVAYPNIVAVLVEAIKEQQSQIDELKALVNTLLAK